MAVPLRGRGVKCYLGKNKKKIGTENCGGKEILNLNVSVREALFLTVFFYRMPEFISYLKL